MPRDLLWRDPWILEVVLTRVADNVWNKCYTLILKSGAYECEVLENRAAVRASHSPGGV